MSWLSNSLHQLNRINPVRSKKNYKLFKTVLAILIVIGLAFKVSQNLAQETEDFQISEESLQEFARYEQETLTAQDSIAAEGWGKSQLLNSAQVLSTGSIGNFSIEPDGIVSYNINGIAAGATNLIAKTFSTPAASGVQYIAQIGDNLLGKPAYAQTGIGFEGLQPLLSIWKAFRNIVYILSSVFFIVLGMMIMFRLKINPQTVLTVQNAIPKVITTLLLVTFSYAIAGLVIDISYVIQNITLATLFTATGKNLTENLFPSKYLIGQTNTFAKISDAGFWDIWRLFYLALPSWVINTIIVIISGIVAGMGAIAGGNAWVGIVAFVLLKLFVAVFIVIKLIQFFFAIMKIYINIILKIVLAPLEIGLGAIPGVKMGFNTWLKDLFANVMVFPITLLFLVIINLILSQTKTGVFSDIWSPKMLNGVISTALIKFPASASGGIINVALGIGALLILPQLPTLIPQAIFAIKPSPFESAIGQSTPKWLSSAPSTAAWLGADATLGSIVTSNKSQSKKITDFINDRLGGHIKEPTVKKVAGTAQAGLRTAGSTTGQKFSS